MAPSEGAIAGIAFQYTMMLLPESLPEVARTESVAAAPLNRPVGTVKSPTKGLSCL